MLVGATALVMLLTSLAFVPVSAWETYVPVATIVATIGVAVAGIAVEVAGERLVRPVRSLVRSIEEAEIGEQSPHDLVRHVPAEVAPLLYGLHVTHARLRRTLRQVPVGWVPAARMARPCSPATAAIVCRNSRNSARASAML